MVKLGEKRQYGFFYTVEVENKSLWEIIYWK